MDTVAVTPHKAAQRLYDGSTGLCRRSARWAAANKLAAAGTALIGVPAAAGAIDRDPRILAVGVAAWAWAAWRRPSPTPDPVTSDDSGEKGPGGGGGEGMSIKKQAPPEGATILKTPLGTCIITPDPTDPRREHVTWETP